MWLKTILEGQEQEQEIEKNLNKLKGIITIALQLKKELIETFEESESESESDTDSDSEEQFLYDS